MWSLSPSPHVNSHGAPPILSKTHACTKQDDAAIPKYIEQQTVQIWNIKSEKYSWTGSVTLIGLLYFQFKAVLRQWAMVLKNLIKARYAKDHFVSTHQARHKTKVEDKYSRAKLVQRTSTSMAD